MALALLVLFHDQWLSLLINGFFLRPESPAGDGYKADKNRAHYKSSSGKECINRDGVLVEGIMS